MSVLIGTMLHMKQYITKYMGDNCRAFVVIIV